MLQEVDLNKTLLPGFALDSEKGKGLLTLVCKVSSLSN